MITPLFNDTSSIYGSI